MDLPENLYNEYNPYSEISRYPLAEAEKYRVEKAEITKQIPGSVQYTLTFSNGAAIQRTIKIKADSAKKQAGNKQDAEKEGAVKNGAVKEDLGDFFIPTVQETSGCVSLNEDGAYPDEQEIFLRRAEGAYPQFALQIFYKSRHNGFYGFGERFNTCNQMGNMLDIRVYEEYKEQQASSRTYLPVPFFFTDMGWGMFTESAERVVYDLDSEGKGVWSILIPLTDFNQSESWYFGSPAYIVSAFSRDIQQLSKPPSWAFGPWMSSNEWNSQERVKKEIDRSRELGIPASVVVIEAWSDEKNFYIWNDAEFTPVPGDKHLTEADFSFPEHGLWPNPKAMIDEIHSRDMKIILWQIPVLKALDEPEPQNTADRDYMIEKGYALYCDNGGDTANSESSSVSEVYKERVSGESEVYRVRPWWFPHGYVIDFSHAEAAAWWMRKRRYLLEDFEIDGFKTDGGEHIWGEDVRNSQGVRGHALANVYPSQYLSSYYKEVKERRNGVLFSRSGFLGAGSSPMHWTGDQNSTWDAHRSVLTAVINAGLSGIPFIGWDIGGLSGPIPDAELYIRSAQMACFGTMMQYHSENNAHRTPIIDRTPWNIAERTRNPAVIPIYRFYAELRMSMIPYLDHIAEECVREHLPMMRPLLLEYPDDQKSWEIFDEYLLGHDMLAAPIFEKHAAGRSVYLPPDRWIDIWTGAVYEGGKSYYCAASWEMIPVFIKEGAEMPFPIPLDAEKLRAEGSGDV